MPRKITHPLLANEVRDALDFISFTLITFLVWHFLFRLLPGHLLAFADGPQYLLPYYQRLAEVHGDWTALGYDPIFLGGTKLLGVMGIQSLMIWLAQLGFSGDQILNYTFLFWQIGFGYFGGKLAHFLLLSVRKEYESIDLPYSLRELLFVVLAFAPMLAWRMVYGQLLIGLLTLPVLAYLLYAYALKRLTIFATLLAFFLLREAFSSIMLQHLVYVVLFGFPILGLYFHRSAFPRKVKMEAVVFTVLLCCGAVAWALPFSLEVWQHFLSDESARGLQKASVIQNGVISQWSDWLHSLTWSTQSLRTTRPWHLLHETNFALGPILLFLFWLPQKLRRDLWIFLPLLFIVLFTAVPTPVLTPLLLRVFPIFEAFRVPARAFLPIGLWLLILSVTGALSKVYPLLRERKKLRPREIAIVGGGLLTVCLLAIYGQELIIWCALLLGIVYLEQRKQIYLPTAMLAAVAILSLWYFSQRLPPYMNFSDTWTNVRRLREQIVRAQPNLQNPLVRSVAQFRESKIVTNTPFVLGFATLDGYWHPLYRFAKLYYALEDKPYRADALLFRLENTAKSYPFLSELYNISYNVILRPADEYELDIKGREKWIAHWITKVDWADDYAQLVELWRAQMPSFANYKQSTGTLLKSDLNFDFNNWASRNFSRCGERQVQTIEARRSPFMMQIQVSAGEDCPLVIGTNFTHNFSVVDQNTKQKLQSFPVDGALLGVLVPSSTTAIAITYPLLGERIYFYAIALALLLLFASLRFGYLRCNNKTI